VAVLRQMIADRRSSGCAQDDMLDALLSGNEGTRAKLSDDQIIDLLITLIYSGYETVSTTSMMAVKYLSDNPKALGQIRVRILCNQVQFHTKTISPIIHELKGMICWLLQKEHLDIRKAKSPEDALDWNDYKSMTFTKAVSWR